MGKKRKGKARWELLCYPGLGFVLEGTPAADSNQSRGSWIPFVRPAAYVSLFIIEERPQEETENIDVLLPSRMREEEDGLCFDVLPAVQPPKGKDPPRPEEEKPSIEDPLTYVPQEVEIPLERTDSRENGVPNLPDTIWKIVESLMTPRCSGRTGNVIPAASSVISVGTATSP